MSDLTHALERITASIEILNRTKLVEFNEQIAFAPGLSYDEIVNELNSQAIPFNREIVELYQWANGEGKILEQGQWFSRGGDTQVRDMYFSATNRSLLFDKEMYPLRSVIDEFSDLRGGWWNEPKQRYPNPPVNIFPFAELESEMIIIGTEDSYSDAGNIFFTISNLGNLYYAFSSITAMMTVLADYLETDYVREQVTEYYEFFNYPLISEIRLRHDPYIREGWEGVGGSLDEELNFWDFVARVYG